LILFLAIAIDYYAAIKIEDSTSAKERRMALILGIVNTSAILFIFKYYNFFIDNLNLVGGFNFSTWNLILPIGLSFHTFQSLSYVIDVYRKKVTAERNLLVYANYVIMFPQLVAGPIERAGHLLPQLKNSLVSRLSHSDFTIGITLFFYGLFKKMVVADSIGPYVDSVYGNYTHHSSMTLLTATMLFAIQIYADFSGYSDMAIGIARTLGFKFNDNFKTPYFSKSVTEFWQRWHISLSSWLRDYLYYPLALGWGKVTKLKLYLSTLITFTLIGLWHGANWTFVIFGTIHGVYLVTELLTKNIRGWLVKNTYIERLPKLHHTFQMSVVFILVSMSFIFFRSNSLNQAIYIFKKIISGFSLKEINYLDTNGFAILSFSILLLFLAEYAIFQKYSMDDIYNMRRGTVLCLLLVVSSILLVFSFGWWGGTSFIYFQF
jgi:D-alanyl-lipoteichoic acid acyltransferase DltB (MBOAT superfamily)